MFRSTQELLSRVCVFVVVWVFFETAPLCLPAQGQGAIGQTEYVMRLWDSMDGLPASAITGVARTSDGYLWVGTLGGLARFDGVRFVIHDTNNLPWSGHSGVSCMHSTRTGDLILATEAGELYRRTDGKFHQIRLGAVPNLGRINCITTCPDGSVWLATTEGGLLRVRNDVCDFSSINSGVTQRLFLQVVSDKHGIIWALTPEGQVYTFDNELKPFELSIQEKVADLAPSRDGGLWISTVQLSPEAGLKIEILKYQDGAIRRELKPLAWSHGTVIPWVNALVEDLSGEVWVGTSDGGLWHGRPGGEWGLFANERWPTQVGVNCFFPDEAGVLWVGFYRSDQLARIQQKPVETIRLPPPGDQSRVHAICSTRSGDVWIATSDAGAFRIRNGAFQHFGTGSGLGSSHIGPIIETSKGEVLVGTWNGLFRFDGANFRRVEGPEAANRRILSLEEDSRGNIWAGVPGAVVRWGKSGVRVFGEAEGLPNAFFLSIEEDRTDTLWVATAQQGLYRLRGERFELCQLGEDLFSAIMQTMCADDGGSLWIASMGQGLFRLKDGHLSHWSTAEGLPSDRFHAIIPDLNGNLWFSSDNGVFGAAPSRFERFVPGRNAGLAFWRLTTAHGLESRLGSGAGHPAGCRSSDGRIWFPNQFAVAVIDPESLTADYSRPPVIIEEVLIDDARYEDTNNITVKSNVRYFEFYFTCPELRMADQMDFSVRLLGWDDDWVHVGHRRAAYYGQLPPGEYLFQVRAGSPDGEWRETQQGLALHVKPLFWQRKSVRAASLLCLIVTAGGAVWLWERGRTRRKLFLLEQNRLLEQERRRIARDLHDDLGSRLTEVLMMGEVLERSAVSFPELHRRTGRMLDKTRQVVGAMDEVVWAVNPENDTLPNLVSYLSSYAQELAETASIPCRLDIQTELPVVTITAQARHYLYLAVKEALNNALRHSSASEVWLKVRCSREELRIVVEDAGKGFDPLLPPRRGNGLRNLKHRLETIGGRMEIESAPGKGTLVRLAYPLPVMASIEFS